MTIVHLAIDVQDGLFLDPPDDPDSLSSAIRTFANELEDRGPGVAVLTRG